MRDLATVTAVILAGGLGTRLRPVVSDRPKVLAHVCGRPFVTYALDQLAAAGVETVVMCIGYTGDQLRRAFGDSYAGLNLTYSSESEPLGTAGALRLALPLIQSDQALVMNGDSFCEVDLNALYRWHRQCGARGTMVVSWMSNTDRYGRVQLDPDNRIVGFREKHALHRSGWINAGIYLLGSDCLAAIPPGRAVSLEEEMFPSWIPLGLYGYQSLGRFLDIGTPEAYAAAGQFFVPGVPT
jgi:NDP-sugar pyrophosphorylase family protein